MILETVAQIGDLLDGRRKLIRRQLAGLKNLDILRSSEHPYTCSVREGFRRYTGERAPSSALRKFDPAARVVSGYRPFETDHASQKLGDKRRRRILVDFFRRADLFEAAALDHRDPVR